jgi:hypothetical protein
VVVQDLAAQQSALIAYVGMLETERAYTLTCAAEARGLVLDYVGTSTRVSDVKINRAMLEVGADLYSRKQSRGGSSGYEGVEMQSMTIPKDPLRMAYPLLRPDLPGFA